MPDPAKRWHVCPVISESFRSQFSEHSPLVLQILYNRGLSTPNEVSAFLGRSQEFHNPFLLQGMNEAVTRIRWAIQRGETLAVYGDFDADGVTATVLLTQTLAALGARVVPYIPHRVDEGYGLHKNALTTLARMPVQLVITVDCGIRSVEEVAHARQLGLDMILTDHHSVGPDLPQAIAVVNPRRPDCPYPFKDLAGVGVAFKLAQALIRAEKSARGQSGPEIAICEEDLLDLVAIGTIADVVPLIGENRHLVKRGLDQLNRAGIASSDRGSSGPAREQSHHEYPLRPGLRSLMHEAGVKPGSVDAATIGFVLGPRLNAAGRLKSAMLSYELLQTADQDRAEELAQALIRAEKSARGQSGPEIALSEEDLLDLVAIGTVADVVPLVGENRHLVKRGLDKLNRSGTAYSDIGSSGPARAQSHHKYPLRPGLRSLMHEAGVKPGTADAAAIGFVLGPRLNAAGRLKSAMLSYELLQTDDEAQAEELARELGRLNRRRQELTRETMQTVREQIREEGDAYLHLVAGEDIEAGIAGLVAGRLAEEFYRPTVVVEKRERWSKGSCRSIAEFNITLALDRCADLLQRHGGHAMAAGFTVATDRLPALKERLQTIAEAELAGEELLPTLSIDAEVELQELDWATYTLLGQLEPFGYGNPAPLLLSRGVEVKEHRTVGAEASHLKLTLSDGQRPWDAIAFRLGEWDGQMPRRLDVAYTLEVNEWNGRKRLQLNVQDLQPN
ncbi:MAG TPA: DHH family phosphoesterase [Anaerolineae bacterium]|nr:DHH family phosphoesterase [Anaerolineae bacterium]